MLIRCGECGKEVSSEAESCPNCGCPINPKKNTIIVKNQQRSGCLYGCFGLMVMFAVLLVIIFIGFNGGFGITPAGHVEVNTQVVTE